MGNVSEAVMPHEANVTGNATVALLYFVYSLEGEDKINEFPDLNKEDARVKFDEISPDFAKIMTDKSKLIESFGEEERVEELIDYAIENGTLLPESDHE